MAKTERKQFLYNTEWLHSFTCDYLQHLTNNEFYMVENSLLTLIVRFHEEIIFDEKYSIEFIEKCQWEFVLNYRMTWPCNEPGRLRDMVIEIFLNFILPDIIKNEKNYRNKKIKTLQQQLDKLQK